jgi:hypothetical protein
MGRHHRHDEGHSTPPGAERKAKCHRQGRSEVEVRGTDQDDGSDCPFAPRDVARHAIAVHGAYVPSPDGQPCFRALPRLKTDEVADVLQVARVRILRYLARRGVVHLLPEAREIDNELAARRPRAALPSPRAARSHRQRGPHPDGGHSQIHGGLGTCRSHRPGAAMRLLGAVPGRFRLLVRT